MAACQPGRAAGAAGTGSAAHRGARARGVRAVPSLDVLVLQMVDQPVDILQIIDFALPEQVIDVPKISLDSAPQRTMLPEPQLAEQLVEVPVPVPSIDDWVYWEETTGVRSLRGEPPPAQGGK